MVEYDFPNYVVTFKSNWADEFDLESLTVMKHDDMLSLKRDIQEAEYPRELYFGSNQSLGFDSWEEVWSCLTFVFVSPELASEFKDTLGLTSRYSCFGTFDIYQLHKDY
jgi:hypothetical protein